MLKITNHPFKITHLWLNRLVNYQNKSIFTEEFYKVGINDFNQLINSYRQLKLYDKTANKYGKQITLHL